MITFVDEKGTEHSALVAYSVTNAVNGELSVKGTIYTNDKVLHGIGRGWRFRLDDEYYRITYAKPNDTGRQIEVEFDAVHQFFYDMSKSMVYTTLNGSKPFETYLQAIFSNSGYTYNLETTVGSIRKENFGNKSRLSLFNDIIKAAGLEFSVRGHVVRILKRVGTDLSTIVRKDFNMNELKIEKDINSFVTYQRGLGAWKDDEDHSKGRYETSYESPLSAIYGRIEADPVVDERYKDTGKLLERLKENVDKSYKVSVEIDMEDLSQAGYRISRPNPGDYIMAINETLGFRQKVRIVSFTSEYDVGGNLISRKVVCNDIGTVQRATSEISHLSRTLTDSIEGSERALQTATRALVSADGKNTNYFGDVKPLDVPKGTLRKGDRLFLTVGDKKQLYFWNGSEWELEPTEFDHEKFDMEFNRKSQEIKKTIQENRQKAEEALRNAGASSLLTQEAKRIGLDSAAKLEAFKSQTTSAQTALSGDLDVLKRTVANEIRPKQAKVETEIAKQVEALVQTKKELAGVKSAQATYVETTTRRLSELTNLANGKASKSELTQTAEQLASKIASVQVGSSRNYFRNSRSRTFTTGDQATYDYRTFIVPDFWKNGDRFKRDYVRISFDVTFPVALANDTQANVHFGAHPWYGYKLTFKGGTTERQHFEFTIDLSSSSETYQTNNVFIRFGTNYGFPADLQVVIENAMLSVGNYFPAYQSAYEDQEDRVSVVESNFKQRADALDAGVNRLTEGLRSKADISSLNVTAENIRQSVKSLETNTQNKLNQMLSLAEFEVRAGSIRQEILNATKDKADKTLVVAEAGKLRTELSTVQEYVKKDSQRQESLQRYARDESARQATSVRELVTRDFVGKSDYQEDVRGLERRFSAISTQTNNDIAAKIAQYKQTVDGQFANITSQIANKANQTDFQRVKETSQLYERILGNTDNGIADNVARMAMTNQLFQVEVGKYSVSGPNLIKNSDFKNGTNEWASTQNLGRLVKHSFYHNGQKDLMRLSNSTQSENYLYSHRFELERNTDYVLNFRGFNNSDLVSYDVFILGRKTGETNSFTIINQVIKSKKLSTAKCEDVSVTFNSGEMDNAYIRFDNNGSSSGTADLYITEVDLYKGYKPRPWQPAPEDVVTDANAKIEAIRTQMTLLQGSWAVQNLTSAGAIVSQINATNNQILIEAEKIRLKGKTLLDELTAIQGYFKRLFVGEGTFATLNADVIRTNSITADKLVFNEALANRLVSNEIITSKLVASRAFVNALNAVTIDASQIVTGTLKGDRIYGGTIRGTNIYGGTLTGHTKIQLGSYGSFDTVNGGLQINVPRDYNSKDGLGVQFIGSYGRGENVPYGLFLYRDSDFTIGNTATDTDEFIMTVEGYIKAKGIGWLKTGLGKVGSVSTGTLAFWKSTVALDFAPSDIYYTYGGQAYGLWGIIKQNFSDKRLKENIVDCKHKALDYIQQFKFKEYDWKKQEDRPQQAHTKIGLIAQEVQAVDPTLVYENGDTLNLDNLRLTTIALKAIQELSQRIETLERKIA